MGKMCAQGHIMDDGWAECPYCKKTDNGPNAKGRGTVEMPTETVGAKTEFMGPAGGHGSTKVWQPSGLDTQHLPIYGWLVRIDGTPGANLGIDHTLRAGATTIGRDLKSNVVLQDDLSSGNHAKIVVIDGKCCIRDVDSTNGVFVNKQRVDYGTQKELLDNDIIELGKTMFVFKSLY